MTRNPLRIDLETPVITIFRFIAVRSDRIIACIAVTLALLGFAILTSNPAHADFRICNYTGSRVGVALGYKDNDGWVTEGWWNLSDRSCEVLLRGALVARYYYIYAVDYDRGGEWSGQAFMCSRDKEFTIRGTENCLARGYDRTGFFEVDTGEQRSWRVFLGNSPDIPSSLAKTPGTAGPPMTPLPPGAPTPQPPAPQAPKP